MIQRFRRPLRRFLDLLVPIAVVLVILFLIVRSWTINHVSEEDLAAETADVMAKDLSAITNIMCQNGSETLVFHLNEDGKWYWIDETFPLDQDAVNEFADVLTTFTPSTVVASGENLDMDSYELSTPLYTLSYTNAGGNTATYHFGKTSGTGTYMKVAGNDATVYTAPANLTNLVQKGLYDYCITDSFPLLSPETVSSFTVKGKDTSITYTRAVLDADSSIYWYNRGRDVTENGTFVACLDNLTSLSYDACLVWNPVEDSLAICGLNDPRMTVTIQYTDPNQRECELVLSIGNERNDTQYFATWSAKNAIYSIDKNAVNGLLAAASAN